MSHAPETADSSESSDRRYAVGIHWFRNGLRLHDNPSLLEACHQCDLLLPLVVLDPDAPFAQTRRLRPGAVRMNFVLDSLATLNDKLRDRGPREDGAASSTSGLVVVLGKPHRVIPRIVNCLVEHQSSDSPPPSIPIYYEQDVAAPVRNADAKVWAALQRHHLPIKVRKFDSHTLHPMESYAALCPTGSAPPTYTGFGKIFHKLGPVPSEVPVVNVVPPLPSQQLLDKITRALQQHDDTIVVHVGTVPTLLDLGYTAEQVDELKRNQQSSPDDHLLGGEDAATALLDTMMKRTTWVAQFEKPKTSPNALTFDTTGLSPYVKHGCLSPRRFYHELGQVYERYASTRTASQPKLSQPPVSLHGQLMWREYNYLMGYLTPNFDKMVDNPVARQIPWDDDPHLLDVWRSSRTGYPFIDAIMTQLRQTGWIHHLARHAVACFLTRGDLWQSWEKGAAVFEEYLIDADWSINNFNWQWLSCTAHFYQYFRCYSPVAFGKKTDPNGDYIRKWLPQFRRYPTKYIYEPWTAPLEVQRRCGVVIGVDYPHPVVEHSVISKSNMQRMKAAYDAHNAANAAT